MLHLGVVLIAVALLAFIAPLLDRQFFLVTVVKATGLSLPAASALLALAGAGLVHLSLRKPSPPAPSLESPKATWRWYPIVALALVAAVVISAFIPVHRPNLSQSYPAPARAQSHEEFIAESFTFSPLPGIPVEGGELRLASATSPRAGEIRLRLEAVPNRDRSLLEDSSARAMRLVRPSLCGPNGVLALRELTKSAVTLSIYERGTAVGEILLPTRFCDTR